MAGGVLEDRNAADLSTAEVNRYRNVISGTSGIRSTRNYAAAQCFAYMSVAFYLLLFSPLGILAERAIYYVEFEFATSISPSLSVGLSPSLVNV